jgi:tetratricopeptide (TPR) repeat protein
VEKPKKDGSALFTLAPSVLPASQFGKRDTLVAASENRRLLNWSFGANSSVSDEWATRPAGTLTDMPVQPAAIGRLSEADSGQGVYAAIFATFGKNVAMVNTARPNIPTALTPVHTMGGQQSPVALREGADGRVSEVVLSDASSNFLRFSATLNETASRITRLGPDTNPVSCSQWTGAPPIVADINADGVQDVLLCSIPGIVITPGTTGAREAVAGGVSQIVVIDGRTGWPMSGVESYTSVRKFATSPALIITTDDEAYAGVGVEGDAFLLLNLRRHKEPSQVRVVPTGPLAPTCPLVLDANSDGKAELFVTRKDGAALLSTSLAVQTGKILWPMLGGSSLHGGSRPRLYEQAAQQAYRTTRALIKGSLLSAQAEFDKGNYDKALEQARLVLGFNPRHTLAREIESSVLAHTHRGSRLATALAVLAAALAAGFFLWRWLATLRLIRRTEAWAAAGQPDAILPAFKSHMRLHRGQPKLILHLAALSQRLGLLPSEFTELLEKAHKAHPNDANTTLTLARLYLHQHKEDADAVPFYEAAAQTEGNTAGYDLMLGRIKLRAGPLDAAHAHLRHAYDQGDRSGVLFDTLAQVYLGQGRISPRHVPVFEVAARNPRGPGPVLRSCRPAKRAAGAEGVPTSGRAQAGLGRSQPGNRRRVLPQRPVRTGHGGGAPRAQRGSGQPRGPPGDGLVSVEPQRPGAASARDLLQSLPAPSRRFAPAANRGATVSGERNA